MSSTRHKLADTPPNDDHVTDYDRKHTKTYLRLLDAAAAGADWSEVAYVVLGLDPTIPADRVRQVYDAHLARARWIMTVGHREIAEGKPDHS